MIGKNCQWIKKVILYIEHRPTQYRRTVSLIRLNQAHYTNLAIATTFRKLCQHSHCTVYFHSIFLLEHYGLLCSYLTKSYIHNINHEKFISLTWTYLQLNTGNKNNERIFHSKKRFYYTYKGFYFSLSHG